MTSPLEQAGAVREPSEYATITMDRHFTGVWTQRSPLRDADVPYLYGKFYSASRFDSLIDGLNREMTARLTDARRPGNSVWNNNTFPAANSFYSYKSVQNGAEVVRVMMDGATAIYDATPGQKSTILNKAISFGAGKARFLGVNSELFISDGFDQVKWIYPGPWIADKSFPPGTLINVGSEPGNVQMALGGISLPLVAYASSGSVITLYVDPQNVPDQFPNLVGVTVAFSGTGVSYLDGHSYAVASVVSTTLGIFTVTLSESVVAETTITGTASTGSGTSGGTQPSFSGTQFVVTGDSGQQWKCYGPAIQSWGLLAPANAPTLTPQTGVKFWQPNAALATWYAVLDNNGNIQVAENANGTLKTGRSYPLFAELSSTTIAQTFDGAIVWANWGAVASWTAATAFGTPQVAGQAAVILDSNGNLQLVTNGNGGNSGGSVPSWATTVGSNTSDGALIWTCLGPGVVIATASWQYAFSTHGVDGSVSTASPLAVIPGGILGPPLVSNPKLIAIAGAINPVVIDRQIDQIWIWRTAQGQPTLVLEDQIPVDPSGSSFTYYEQGIPDTPLNGSGALDALIAAPIADANDPPPATMTSPCWHLGRVFAILNNTVINSGGPDTLVGNGSTAFAPLSFAPLTEQPIRLYSGVTSQGPTLFIFGTSNVWAIYGLGTASSPFTPPTPYVPSVGLLSYDAIDVVGSTFYLMTGKGKAVSLDPSAGYVEYGFPIGDQFSNVTTGAGGLVPSGVPTGALYSPSSTYVTWAEISSGDSAVYVADGALGWFRYSPVASPESGYLWSPRAVIVGGTSAVQAIETSPGVTQLLIGPPSGTPGPILFRDSTVRQDWSSGAYHSYPSYDVKGNIVLCQSGEVAEIAHIGLKSIAVGTKPAVGLLLGEISPTASTPFDWLSETSDDPPDLPPSGTLYSDRYDALQNGVCPKCDNFQLAVDYGIQSVPDELLMFSVYGAKHAERKQQ